MFCNGATMRVIRAWGPHNQPTPHTFTPGIKFTLFPRNALLYFAGIRDHNVRQRFPPHREHFVHDLHYVHPLHDTPDNLVLGVEMGGTRHGDEKLGPVRMCAWGGHAHNPRNGVRNIDVFVLEKIATNICRMLRGATTASAIHVASLNYVPFSVGVKLRAFVRQVCLCAVRALHGDPLAQV